MWGPHGLRAWAVPVGYGAAVPPFVAVAPKALAAAFPWRLPTSTVPAVSGGGSRPGPRQRPTAPDRCTTLVVIRQVDPAPGFGAQNQSRGRRGAGAPADTMKPCPT